MTIVAERIGSSKKASLLRQMESTDIRCAIVAASSIHVAFCEFFWTDLKSIFVLRSSSPSTQTSSSITLAWCTLNNSVHFLTPIVEDMQTDSAEGAFNMNMVGTRIENMNVVGADGVCVSQTNHRNDITSFAGISTTVSGLRIMNVSSQPVEVKKASSLFSQRMIGCAIWGSNNHLSGSALRDMNGGGSFLCSNSSFDWCHTTSAERPSFASQSSPTIASHSPTLKIPNQAEPGDDPDDPYTGKSYDGVDRFITQNVPITFTRCEFTNMKYTVTSSSEMFAGGSAIFLNSSSNPASIVSCSFSNCSVISMWTVYGGCVFLYKLTTSTNTVHNCSFADWYPSNDAYSNQKGGGIGTYGTSAPLQITNTNFTLSGDTTNTNNGGFFSSCSSAYVGQSTTITDCRFIGDAKTTGLVMNFDTSSSSTGTLSVTDSQILNTNCQLAHKALIFESSSGFTRTDITNTAIRFSYASSDTRPFLFVDCQLDNCSVSSNSLMMFLISGTSFTGKPTDTSTSIIQLSSSSHVVIHKCDFTDCSPGSTSLSLITSNTARSLVVDTCSFTRCSGGSSIVYVEKAYSFIYFCSFTNVTGLNSSVLTFYSNHANFFESCRFDLEETKNVDIYVPTSQFTYLNDTVVTGCTSNRQMYFGTYNERKELTTVKVVTAEAEKNEMRVGTWSTESEEDPQQQIPTFSSLSDAFATLQPSSPPTNIITLSDGNFTENAHLEVSQLVEIVGAGSTIDDSHSTQLTTKGIISKSTGKLTLRSLRLMPSSPSSVLASSEDSGIVILLNVIVEDISEHSTPLFKFTAGSSEIRHSFFKNIESTDSLIRVLGTSSLTITNTLFLTITRTSTAPIAAETTQCASCIEGKTSGAVKLMYCRFGACTTNGRAGAIDLDQNDENSAVEISYCYFDRNSGGTDVPDAVRGDDVVLKSFDDSSILLDFSTIQSFPSLFSFLINSEHPVVPPPALLSMSNTGVDDPLTWSYSYGRISKSLIEKHSLQFLLESRFRNNIKTELKTDFSYNETMTPFVFQNSTVFAFDELTTPAFTCDKDSSLELINTVLKLTNPTLTYPFVDATGPSVYVSSQSFFQPITLDNTPFVRLNRSEKDADLVYQSTAPRLEAPLTAPFISTAKGAFLHIEDGTVHFQQDKYNSSSDEQGGLFSCSAKQGGVFFSQESSVNMNGGTFSNCEADEGGIAYLFSSSLLIESTTLVSNSAKRGGVFFIDFGNDSPSSVISKNTVCYTNNTAHDEDENGVDWGKGGAIFVTGTTTSKTPLVLTDSRFEENTATFGNDVFVEESVVGETGPDRLSGCVGESYSRFPHLEIENHNLEDDELHRISNFIPYPSVRISNYGSDVPICKWSIVDCKTLIYALQFLQTTYANESSFQRQCVQVHDAMTTEPIELDKPICSISVRQSPIHTTCLSQQHITRRRESCSRLMMRRG
ncbi:hypothetical protein BLNAU_19853 [Blattamonas nauphoetae]|uniref:Right handed beta helix domain-containing protein n=1 Tax=Blattamonas nauphoetae TaxID=2049346 RepID=A0ABQ9X0V3_9EUKA|nr:hypothetical protein BLNAU_19853 [Blattamonas nauphoetae]